MKIIFSLFQPAPTAPHPPLPPRTSRLDSISRDLSPRLLRNHRRRRHHLGAPFLLRRRRVSVGGKRGPSPFDVAASSWEMLVAFPFDAANLPRGGRRRFDEKRRFESDLEQGGGGGRITPGFGIFHSVRREPRC